MISLQPLYHFFCRFVIHSRYHNRPSAMSSFWRYVPCFVGFPPAHEATADKPSDGRLVLRSHDCGEGGFCRSPSKTIATSATIPEVATVRPAHNRAVCQRSNVRSFPQNAAIIPNRRAWLQARRCRNSPPASPTIKPIRCYEIASLAEGPSRRPTRIFRIEFSF